MIENRIQTGGVDANQPVGLGAAQGGAVETVILGAGAEVLKALADGVFLHGGQPQAKHGLFAVCQDIHVAEDELALAPGVAGVHDLGHILPVHKVPHQQELRLLVSGHDIAPVFRNDGKIRKLPLGVFIVILLRAGQLRQMPQAPGDDPAVSFDISILAVSDAESGGDGLRHGRLFGDNEFIHSLVLSSI